jgi:hypothetical protein
MWANDMTSPSYQAMLQDYKQRFEAL